MRVLIFEDDAHVRGGHRPVWVAQVTRELSEAGHEAHVLTSRGWADGHTVPGATGMQRMSRHYVLLNVVGEKLSGVKLLSGAGYALRQFALARSVSRGVRRLGGHRDTSVIVLSMTLDVLSATILAPAHARWAVYEHQGPGFWRKASPRLDRMQSALASQRERSRRRRGGHVRLVANNQAEAEDWLAMSPWLDHRVVPSASRSPVTPLPRGEARRALGIDGSESVALAFGHAHQGKDLSTVFAAFSGTDPPAQLVVAGLGIDDALAKAKDRHPGHEFGSIRALDGYQSAERVLLLHSAADFAVISRDPSWTSDSGTLSDAIAHGIPVCCSDTGVLTRLVREYKLGVLFRPGDAGDLENAAHTARVFRLDANDRRRFLEDHAPKNTARELLLAAADP